MNKPILICLLILSIFLSGCGRIKDPVTGKKAYGNLREIFEDVFSEGPENPWDEKGEFETTEDYNRRLLEQQMEYYVEAVSYYEGIEQETFIIIHEIKELTPFDADVGSYTIPFQMSSAQKNPLFENSEPDFRLYIPPYVVENLHFYNGDFFGEGGTWYRAQMGGLGDLIFSVTMSRIDAKLIREVAADLDVFLRIGVQLEFPEAYQGYRFLRERYEPFQEERSNLESPFVTALREEDLAYGAGEGKVTVKVVSAQFVDEDGVVYHKWPGGLSPAQTPTVAPTQGPTPFPTPVLPIPPTTEPIPSETPAEESFCPEAMEMRMVVGKRGKVTFGDPRRVRLRLEPSTSAGVLRLLNLGTEFLVIGGPVCADGFVWWEIEFGSYSGYWVAEGENENYHIEPIG